MLNPLGINCLRTFPVNGRVVWGARTLRGADQLADEWKYIPVRRLALFIEESLYRGTQWVVFEPNDEPLWAQIRLNVGAFMQNLFRQGAFQGTTPREAYFVKCDNETTTQNDINLGIVNIVVGFAPLKPAEFVVIKIQQMAGQIADLSEEHDHGPVQRQRAALRSVQELQVPREVGRPLRRRRQQGRRAQAHDRGGQAPRGRRPAARSRKSPGRTEYEAITLERGVTHDTEFEKWANKVWNFGSGLGAEVSLKDFRKDIIIEVYNEAGQLALAYKVFRCWVSEFQALPDLDANANAVAIQTHQARERGLGARLRGGRAGRADASPSRPDEPTACVRSRAADCSTLWERGAARHPLDRALLLLRWRGPTWRRETLADLPLGRARRGAARAARSDASAPRIARLCSTARRCGERAGARRSTRASCCAGPTRRAGCRDRGRRPARSRTADQSRPRARSPASADADRAARQLLTRCVACARRDVLPGDDALPTVDARLEALDPDADLALAAATAPPAAHAWHGAVRRRRASCGTSSTAARRALLREVHVLARAYGWSEARRSSR